MKILKQGVDPGDREIEWTCKGCSSIMLAKVSEGVLIYDRDGTMVKFKCPVCNKEGFRYPKQC